MRNTPTLMPGVKMHLTNQADGWAFELPAHLEAGDPPESRGLSRSEVRLMVSYAADDRIEHTCFDRLPDCLEPGDVLVINTSATLPAALHARRDDGSPLELHLSTRLPGSLWVVELRSPKDRTTVPFYDARPGEKIDLPGQARAALHIPYRPSKLETDRPDQGRTRLWIASLELSDPLDAYLERYGFPIRYQYVPQNWPISYYQTVYAAEPGSAEMPSAGRAFTHELITRLVSKGVQVVPLVLHTGVASLESHEPPYEEYYRVPAATARLINAARAGGRQHVIATGTTTVRALETVTDRDRIVHPGEGWTDLVITPQRGLRAVDALLTGFHEPRSSHLMLLQALANQRHLRKVYAQAVEKEYLWHEFGDLHLLWGPRKGVMGPSSQQFQFEEGLGIAV